MRRTLMTLMVAAAVLSAHGADDICSDVETCVTESGSKCDRTEKNCPPCLYKPRSSSKYMCYELNLFNSCDFGLTYCAPKSESSSGDGSDTPEPTTVKPTKKPTKKPTVKPSNETSSSGSGSDAVKPATKTPKPTTKAPTVAPTTPVPTPDTNATLSSQETASPSSAESSNAKSSGSKMPMFIGIGAAAVVVVAVVAFFIWKKNRDDDDDDSDDDEYRFKQAPKTLPATRAAAPTPSVATTASYNNSSGSRPPSSPVKYGGGGGGYGKGYGNGGNQYQHYASGNTYAYGNGHDDFGSPSTIDGSQRGMHTGRGGMAYDSHDNSNDSRDVWGNAAPAKQSRPVPTVKTTQPAYREKRTLSNVSVEF